MDYDICRIGDKGYYKTIYCDNCVHCNPSTYKCSLQKKNSKYTNCSYKPKNLILKKILKLLNWV